jgi:hypothetical protein
METDYSSQSHVALHSEVPFEIRQAVFENRIADEHADIKRSGEFASKIKHIAEEYDEKLRKFMGAEKYEQFREYIAEKMREQAKVLVPPRGPEMSREELNQLRVQRKEMGLAFLNKLGIDLKELKALNESARSRFAKLTFSGSNKDSQSMMILPEDVPSSIRSDKLDIVAPAVAWSVFTAPYPGWAWNYSWYVRGFSASYDRFLNSASGLVGSWTYLTDGDAGDNDAAWVRYNTSVGFWYQMPTAGLLDVWIEGQPASDRHYLSLYDEWGWSDSSVEQHNYVTMKATAGSTSSGLSLALMSWFTESGYTDGHWDVSYLTLGSSYWAHLYSDISFAAGQWVYVEVGNRNWNYCFANDVSEYSFTDFRWFIKSVYVRPS